MAEARPGNSERGWNDPPYFSFGPPTASPAYPAPNSPQRTLLSKRVAYPLSATNTTQPVPGGDGSLLPPVLGPPVVGGVQLLPPALDTTTPLPVPLVVPNLVPVSPPVSPTLASAPDVKAESIEKCMERLGCSTDSDFLELVDSNLQKVHDRCKACMKDRTSEEIRRKLKLFRDSWDRLSSAVKVQMSYLSIVLSNDRFEPAYDIHLGLMVDYTAEVNQWMVGVKKLIHEESQRVKSQQLGNSHTQDGESLDGATENCEPTNGEASQSQPTKS